MSQIKVELLDWMGDDDSVVDAARVSFAKRSDNYTAEQNEKLIKYLAREGHDMPFAHTAITFRCSAPLPTRTHAFKSKVGFVENEESRRYISSTPEVFIPDAFRSAAKDKKQGSGDVHPDSDRWLDVYTNETARAVDFYLRMIEECIAPEQARYILPQGVMVNWVWTGSLLAYARFCKLRLPSDTQKETQEFARHISGHLSDLFPVSWPALTEGIDR